MRRPRFLRVLVPVTLAVAGVYLLIGCIPVPGTYRKEGGGPRPEERIGAASSRKPLRLGHATREHAEAVLGRPKFRSYDDRVVIYFYNVMTGYGIWPLCFRSYSYSDGRFLRLDFGEDGTLQGYKVYKSLREAQGQDKFDQVPTHPNWPLPTRTKRTEGSGDDVR